MAVIRGEPAEVWLRDGTPARFVWRDRMYTVMFVLERPAAKRASEPALDLEQRECWRVEATPERAVPPTTYQLCWDPTSDRWSLSRG
jgi:hypothetical protein